MPVITAIKPQKSKKRVNVYLDGKFGFGLDLQTYLKEGLKIEQILKEEEVASIVKRGEFQTSYDKILMFASLRPRSEKEYRDWFRKHKVHESIHEEILSRLKRLELLDDRKFAVWWLEQRIQFKPKSRRELIQELRLKGIPQPIIEDAVRGSNLNERVSLNKLLEKKKYLWKNLSGFEKRKKIYSFLAQRGYDSEVIRDIVGGFNDD